MRHNQCDSLILASYISQMNDMKKKREDERPIIGFWDKEEVDGVYNKVLLLVINAKVVNHTVPRTLIQGGSFYDIMYVDLFEKLILDKEELWYVGSAVTPQIRVSPLDLRATKNKKQIKYNFKCSYLIHVNHYIINIRSNVMGLNKRL